MAREVEGIQAAPPVAAGARRGGAAQRRRRGFPAGVDGANWHAEPSLFQWVAEVAIVREDDRCVDLTVEQVDQEVARDVHVRALLLERCQTGAKYGGSVRAGDLFRGE